MGPYSLVATFHSENIKSHECKRERVLMYAHFHSETAKIILVHLTWGDLPWTSSTKFLFLGLLYAVHKVEIRFYGLAQKRGIYRESDTYIILQNRIYGYVI